MADTGFSTGYNNKMTVLEQLWTDRYKKGLFYYLELFDGCSKDNQVVNNFRSEHLHYSQFIALQQTALHSIHREGGLLVFLCALMPSRVTSGENCWVLSPGYPLSFSIHWYWGSLVTQGCAQAFQSVGRVLGNPENFHDFLKLKLFHRVSATLNSC